MCFFKKKPKPEPLTLPFPEEPADYTQTVDNINISVVVNEWLIKYNVPREYWGYWLHSIIITVRDDIAVAACAWAGTGGVRYLDVRPEWLNVGVIAHEQAHCSWELLTDEQRAEFATLHNSLKDTEPLIKLLYSINTYGLTNDNEGHSEVYRFLGIEKMPEVLRQFYPKLN